MIITNMIKFILIKIG